MFCTSANFENNKKPESLKSASTTLWIQSDNDYNLRTTIPTLFNKQNLKDKQFSSVIDNEY